jgi:hypothetical protein
MAANREDDRFPTGKAERVDSPSVVGFEAPETVFLARHRRVSTFTTDDSRLQLKGP